MRTFRDWQALHRVSICRPKNFSSAFANSEGFRPSELHFTKSCISLIEQFTTGRPESRHSSGTPLRLLPMDEHKFPFDLDADLRREVKLEVERAIVERELGEIKRRMFPLVRWLLIILFLHGVAAAFFGIPRTAMSFATSSVLVLLVSLFFNSKEGRESFGCGVRWLTPRRESEAGMTLQAITTG